MNPSGYDNTAAIGLEWIYLSCLMAGYLIVVVVLFVLVEAKWIGELR